MELFIFSQKTLKFFYQKIKPKSILVNPSTKDISTSTLYE